MAYLGPARRFVECDATQVVQLVLGTQGVSYPSPVGAFAFPLTSAPGRLRLGKCLRQGTNLRA